MEEQANNVMYVDLDYPTSIKLPDSEYKIDDIYRDEAGYYQIGESGNGSVLQLWIGKKPSWIARTMCRWLLDWIWVDNSIDKPEVKE